MWGQSRWRGPFTQPRALPQSPQDRRPAAGRAQLCAGTRDYYSHPERPSPEARCQLHRGTCGAEPWQRQLQALSCMASAGLGGTLGHSPHCSGMRFCCRSRRRGQSHPWGGDASRQWTRRDASVLRGTTTSLTPSLSP